jgi:Helix-turn-helix
MQLPSNDPGHPWARQSMAEVDVCPGCGEVEQTAKMYALSDVSAAVQDGTFPPGTLVCEDCLRKRPVGNRTDRRGHWPRDKRRAAAPLPSALRRQLIRAIERQDYTRRGVARMIRVSDRTVRRWIADEDWPLPVNIKALAHLLGRRHRP